MLVKAVMSIGPDLPMTRDPPGRNVEMLRSQGAWPRLRVTGSGDQAGTLEDLHVLGDRLLCHREWFGQFVHRRISERQALEDRPPGRVGQRREHLAQLVVKDLHTPDPSTTARLHNQIVVDRVKGSSSAEEPHRP